MQNKNRTYAIIAVAAVLGLLFGCIMGMVVGGVAGLLIGRSTGRINSEQMLGQALDDLPVVPLPTPDNVTPLPPSTQPWGMIEGALIVQLMPGAPAEAAGLRVGDVITGVDRIPIDANHALPDVIAQYKQGDRVTVDFWRAGQEASVQVALAEHPDYPGRAYLGVKVETMHPSMQRPRGFQG